MTERNADGEKTWRNYSYVSFSFFAEQFGGIPGQKECAGECMRHYLFVCLYILAMCAVSVFIFLLRQSAPMAGLLLTCDSQYSACVV